MTFFMYGLTFDLVGFLYPEYPEYTKSFFEKGTEKQKINKQCPFLVTTDHFFAVLRARMVLSGSSITNRHTTLCYINHP